MAIDASGNLYIADAGNNTVRKITPGGNVSTLAGSAGLSGTADGTGAAARFGFLKGIAVDKAGNVYAIDNNAVRRISSTGVVTTLAGAAAITGDADGSGAAARFNQPWGVAVDATGNVYVADTDNYLIRKITPSGMVSTHAGTRGMRGTANGSAASATFLGPRGIAINAAGRMFITDWLGPPAPNIPEGSTFIRKIDENGTVSTVAGNYGGETGPALFRDTSAIAADAADNVYVAAMRTVRRVSPNGTVSTVAAPTDRFQTLEGIAIATDGTLYVADSADHTVSRITQDGVITLIAGQPEQAGSADVP
jgi:hypothetical protein